MSDIDIFDVKIADPRGIVLSKIEVSYEPSLSMVLTIPGTEPATFQGNDLFECMKALRWHLESQSLLLLCNGARVDTYPSQLARQMGRARKVYIATLGRSTTREDLVDIFAEAPAEKIGSVDAQKAYHDDWLRSLGWEI